MTDKKTPLKLSRRPRTEDVRVAAGASSRTGSGPSSLGGSSETSPRSCAKTATRAARASALGEKRARPLVLDASVAHKFYLPEEGHEQTVGLLEVAEAGAIELLAPGTILPEGFNAIA